MVLPTVVERMTALSLRYLPRLIAAGAIVLLGFVCAAAVQKTANRMLRHAHAEVRLFAGRLAYAAVVLVAILWALGVSGVHVAALATLLGALGLAISLSLQDVAKNLIAGLYLLMEHPFRVGDRISVQTFSGRVEVIDLRTTVLRTDDGEQVIVPNTIILSDVVVNQADRGSQATG